ncbi:MAG: PAS domain S-box protein, partial [Terriglobales bacterium]
MLQDTAAAEPTLAQAQAMLEELAGIFLLDSSDASHKSGAADGTRELPNMQARYRSLVEQLPAVVFLVYLDRGIGEAYVSPYIEAALGFSQAEWLEDPVRWYRHIHPEDNLRWSEEAADMFLTGKPLRSVYRVIARDGHVVWFHCEAKMVRSDDGHPWFIKGVAFDITELKRAEEALQQERNFVSAILQTVGTLIMVLDLDGRIVQFNRACEQTTGHRFDEVKGKHPWDQYPAGEDRDAFKNAFEQLRMGKVRKDCEYRWITGEDGPRLISWSGTVLPDAQGDVRHVIATGIDITESKRLEKAILDISAREEHRIGQDLHDGLGQHLTGIAFMSKVLERKLADKSVAEAADATKIVRLVNEAIHKTRELSRGLLPVVSDARGLMSALEHYSSEVVDLFGLACRFECDRPVLIYDETAANHLFRIAQEAVNNAIKHGRGKNIVIRLWADGDDVSLSITDDGLGLPQNVRNSTGMGLHIMNYRAKMIGATLEVQPCSNHGMKGTVVTCTLQPVSGESNAR